MTLYQCHQCRRIWNPRTEGAMNCARCGAELYYEALDTWSFAGIEIDGDRVLALAHNLAIAAGLCRAERLGWVNGYNDCTETEGCNAPFEDWKSGSGKPAPHHDPLWPAYRRAT